MPTCSPLESHRAEQQDENIQWMIQHGASLEEACRRAGVAVGTYEKRIQPARKGSGS